jgi:hypothetical protein
LNSFAQNNSYLCIPDQKIGYKFINGNWRNSNLVDKEKYLVKQKGNEFRFNYFDSEDKNSFKCNKLKGNDLIECNSVIRVLIDEKIKRFQIYFPLGYLVDEDSEGGFSPSITIGKCSKL